MPEPKSENYSEKLLNRYSKGLVISFLAGIGVCIGLAFYADIGEVKQSFIEFRWAYIPLILALAFMNYLLRFCKWDYYLTNIGINLEKKDSLAIFLSGLTMSVTPAKAGEVFKSYLLKRINGTEISKSVPVVFAERVTDVLSLLILAAISFSAFQYGKEALLVILALSVAIISVVKSRRISDSLLRVCESIPLINRLSNSLRIAYDGAHTLFSLKNLIVATAISVVSWGFECLAMYFVLLGFGVDASVLLSTFAFSFSLLVGAVSLIPGGLGMVEGSSTGLLMLAGISKGVAVSATIVTRFCTLWFGVTVGLIALFLVMRIIAKIQEDQRAQISEIQAQNTHIENGGHPEQ
jgi:uncharacterized protein (TIRG00374 family)